MKRFFIALFILVLFISFSSPVMAESLAGRTYIYNSDGQDALSPDAYTFSKSIKLVDDEKIAVNPQDMFITKSGEIYILDTDNNRVLVYDKSFKLKLSISKFMQGAEILTLNKPEGIHVEKSEILIADTGNNRVLRLDLIGNVLQIINKPDEMTGVHENESFLPAKVATDSTGRVYIVARNNNMGIISLTSQGKFISYIGAPKVQYSLIDMIWRKFSTEEQLNKMMQYMPTEYSNITSDGEGFIYGTISYLDAGKISAVIASKDNSGSVTSIKRINSVGDDVLKRLGHHPPIGDLIYDEHPSRIIDVALMDNGIYSMLDSTKGRIFTYDDNGNLLFAFGGNGDNAADTSRPSAISYLGSSIVVLDSQRAEVFVYEPTPYGELLFESVEAQYTGDFDTAYKLWSKVAKNNINFEYAFVGLGNANLSEKQYSTAMENFKFADDKDGYSKAKELHRKVVMKTVFPIVFIIIIMLIVFIIMKSWVARFIRYSKGLPANMPRKERKQGGKTSEELRYAFYLTVHPFKGFWEIKHESKGSPLTATILLVVFLVVSVLSGYYSGYLFNSGGGLDFNPVKSLFLSLLMFFTFCIGNWSITSLFEGEGTLKDVYKAAAYSLTPMTIAVIILLPLSNVLVLSEAAFYTAIYSFGIIWMIFLFISGTLVTHQYGLGKTIVVIVAVVFAMSVIVYIGLLFFNLIQQMSGFVYSLIQEFQIRYL